MVSAIVCTMFDNPNKLPVVLTLLSLLLSTSLLGEKGPEKRAKVISQELKEVDGGFAAIPIGGAIRTVPVKRQSNVVVIETDQYRTTLVEDDRKTLILPVNSTVTAYQDDDRVIILDEKGRKFKFSPTHVEKLIERPN